MERFLFALSSFFLFIQKFKKDLAGGVRSQRKGGGNVTRVVILLCFTDHMLAEADFIFVVKHRWEIQQIVLLVAAKIMDVPTSWKDTVIVVIKASASLPYVKNLKGT